MDGKVRKNNSNIKRITLPNFNQNS